MFCGFLRIDFHVLLAKQRFCGLMLAKLYLFWIVAIYRFLLLWRRIQIYISTRQAVIAFLHICKFRILYAFLHKCILIRHEERESVDGPSMCSARLAPGTARNTPPLSLYRWWWNGRRQLASLYAVYMPRFPDSAQPESVTDNRRFGLAPFY